MILLGACVPGCRGEFARAQDLERGGDVTGAAAIYRAILEKDPDDLQSLSALATNLVLSQQSDQALPIQERLVSLDSTDVQTRIELGFNYLNHQGRPGDAVRVMTEASVLDPTAQHLTFLAQAQMRSGVDGGAEQTLHRAIEVDAQYAYSYRLLGSLLRADGRIQELEKLRDEALLHGVTIQATP